MKFRNETHEEIFWAVALTLGAIFLMGVMYLLGVRAGQQDMLDEACSRKAGRYYLQEMCDGVAE